jgi:hypothetical protein
MAIMKSTQKDPNGVKSGGREVGGKSGGRDNPGRSTGRDLGTKHSGRDVSTKSNSREPQRGSNSRDLKRNLAAPTPDSDSDSDSDFESSEDEDCSKSLVDGELEIIEALAKPPPRRDLEYFVGVGLSAEGDNPHRLKEHKHVPTTEIVKIFGKFSNRTGYRYKDCRDPALREKIEKIWKIAYGKERMPKSNVVSTQFGLGIVAEEMGRQIAWAAFAEETNASQHAKYQQRVKSAMGAAKAEKTGGVSGVKVKRKRDSDYDLGSKVTQGTQDTPASNGQQGRSKEWRAKLAAEVTQLLQLCSMEVEASKQQLQRARKEKQDMVDRVAANRICLETVQGSLLEEVCKT